MAKPSNDRIECHYFEKFRKIYSLPDGYIAYGDKPDVIVRGSRKLGIEITNFYVLPGNLLESELRQGPLREEVVAAAQELYMAGGGKSELTFSFDKGNHIIKTRIKTLTSELASFAHSLEHRPRGEIEKCLFRDSMPEVWSVFLNSEEYSDAKWRITQVHEFGLTSKDRLEAIVREKESKAAQYEPCDAYWLLVVVDGIKAAQEQEIRSDNLCVSSEIFEKIIVFHTFGHIVEAKLK